MSEYDFLSQINQLTRNRCLLSTEQSGNRGNFAAISAFTAQSVALPIGWFVGDMLA